MSRVLQKVTPKWIKRIIEKQIETDRMAVENNIPKYEIEEKHIANLKAVKDREILLGLFPKNGVVAELGVNKGDFSDKIYRITTPQKLHLVDMWNSTRYHQGLKEMVIERFANEIKEKRIEINIGSSTEVVKTFKDAYFDWIYIDTNHSYKTTKMELELYAQKIKEGGIISGHDYKIGNWVKGYRYGVIEAVYEFCTKNDWEIIFITMENKIHPSFAIRKLLS